MKTPEEIKKGLKCCGTTIAEGRRTTCNAQCPYINEGIFCRNVLHGDTESYIVQLELYFSQISRALCGKESATICEALDAVSQLKSRLAQVKRERDAAICELPHNCWNCIYHLDNPKEEIDTEGRTIHCYCTADVCYPEDNSSWQWHGVCEENTKEEGS